SSDTPLQFATNRNHILRKELEHNLQLHGQFLANGDSNLNKLRSMLFQNFEQLSQGYYSVSELYSREIELVESLFANFERWDNKRTKILDKIRSIKNPDKKYGIKLTQLLDKASDIDTEILELETRLATLRNHKTVINSEIEVTSSVLESKTSRYVEMLRGLENQGRQAMLSFLSTSGVPLTEVDNVVKTVPIDITFIHEYNNMKSESIIKTPPAPLPAKHESIHRSTMGIQPLIIPEEPPTQTSPPAIKSDPKDKELWNHGYGPSAYEKGYEKGVQVSSTVKQHIELFLQNFVRSPDSEYTGKRVPQAKVDDDTNTIREKLDLEPIVRLLDHKLNALNDLNQQASTDAILFHEYSVVWSDIVQRVKVQEDRLEDYMTESVPSPDTSDPTISRILTDTLTYIQSQLLSMQTTLAKSTKHNPLIRAIGDEVDAIFSALAMVSKD
ncbi:uncharacterized protein CANTADRAFT_42614, partial [Suhomyces tanzawaensis NRRL Y-17324]